MIMASTTPTIAPVTMERFHRCCGGGEGGSTIAGGMPGIGSGGGNMAGEGLTGGGKIEGVSEVASGPCRGSSATGMGPGVGIESVGICDESMGGGETPAGGAIMG